MKFKPFYIFIVILLFVLTACGPAEEAVQEGVLNTAKSTRKNTSTPKPTSTVTLEPTFTSTTTPSQTPTITPTPTQAAISPENLENLALVKSIGNKSTFSSFDSISTSRSGDLLAISGLVNKQVESIVYNTSDFSIVAAFPNLNNLIFSSDESRIAGNNLGDIEIWDLTSENAATVFKGSTNPIIDLAWSSNKGEISGIDTKNTLFIWDSDTGELIFTSQLPESLFFVEVKLEYSPSGKFLSIIGFDSTIRIWDGGKVNEINGHSEVVTQSSWSPDEQFLATCSEYGGEAYVWRMQDFGRQFQFEHQYGAKDIAWSPSGEIIATVESRGMIKLWNIYTGGLKHSFANSLTPLQISWSPDGSKIAGLYNNAEIKIYDISTKQEYIQPENIQKMNGGFLWIDEMILLYNSNLRIQIWNIQSAETEMLIDPELGSPDLIALSPNGNTLAYVDFGGVVYLVDVESEEILYIIDTEITSGIQDVAWSSDNKMLGVASAWDKKVIVINAETGIVTNTLEDDSLRQYIYLAWTNNNNELLTGAGEGKILIWDIESSEILHVFEMYETPIMDLEISQDGEKLAAIGVRGEIYVWNTSDWSREFILQGPNDFLILADLSFSPDGNMIASSGIEFDKWYLPETRYQIWDCNSQELINEWNYDEINRRIAYSPDGLFLATSTGNIWDLSTGDLVFKEECNGESVLWTTDNKFVVFVDNLVDFWGIRP